MRLREEVGDSCPPRFPAIQTSASFFLAQGACTILLPRASHEGARAPDPAGRRTPTRLGPLFQPLIRHLTLRPPTPRPSTRSVRATTDLSASPRCPRAVSTQAAYSREDFRTRGSPHMREECACVHAFLLGNEIALQVPELALNSRALRR